jgi:glucokinase
MGGRLIIGVDLGGTKVNAAAVDEDGTLLQSEREKTLPEQGADAVIGRVAALIRAVVAKAGGEVQAVCVGVPGGVDDAHGVVDDAPNLGWKGVPLARQLSTAIGGAPVFLDNDVRVAVLGEHVYGAGKGTQTMVGIWVGTGIGGGIVMNGQLHEGARGVAGEIGHMVLMPGGPRCSCGRRGCVEALASRTAIERNVRTLVKMGRKSNVLNIMKKEGRPRLTSSVVARALADGDPVMTRVFVKAQRYIGLLVGSLINALDPEVVVIGGGLAERLGEQMVEPIRAIAYKRLLVQRDRERVRIVATELKDRAAPLGAAFVARRRVGQLTASNEPTSPPSAPSLIRTFTS